MSTIVHSMGEGEGQNYIEFGPRSYWMTPSSAPVFWRSDMWLTDTKREDLDRLIKWTPWYSTSCNSQSQFSTATIKIALKSTAAYFAAASISYIAATAAAVADHGDHIGIT